MRGIGGVALRKGWAHQVAVIVPWVRGHPSCIHDAWRKMEAQRREVIVQLPTARVWFRRLVLGTGRKRKIGT